jgi:hypothetical protein
VELKIHSSGRFERDLIDQVGGLWSGSKRGLFMCCVLSLMLLDFVLRLPSPLISDFLFAQWLFSYDRGFIRRGLVGQICHTALGSLCYTKSLIEHVALSANLLYMLLLLMLLWRLVRHKISIGVLIFCFVLATYTGGIQFLSRDIGRFDIFLNLLVILYYFIVTSQIFTIITMSMGNMCKEC